MVQMSHQIGGHITKMKKSMLKGNQKGNVINIMTFLSHKNDPNGENARTNEVNSLPI